VPASTAEILAASSEASLTTWRQVQCITR